MHHKLGVAKCRFSQACNILTDSMIMLVYHYQRLTQECVGGCEYWSLLDKDKLAQSSCKISLQPRNRELRGKGLLYVQSFHALSPVLKIGYSPSTQKKDQPTINYRPKEESSEFRYFNSPIRL